jgi:ribose 5-phosphate isomerase A
VSGQDRYKQQAAERAVELVECGMVVGLGSGSTALSAVRRIGALLRAGTLADIIGVPTSDAVGTEALRLGIPILPADLPQELDLTIDGADEVDAKMDLIKGGGGALLREKIVAQASRRLVIVVDETKLSPALGTRRAIPVEVVPFGWRSQVRYLESILPAAAVSLRLGADGLPATTNQGNFIVDCAAGPIQRPGELAIRLAARAGLVEHGLFLGLATDLIVAGHAGVVHRRRTPAHGDSTMDEPEFHGDPP